MLNCNIGLKQNRICIVLRIQIVNYRKLSNENLPSNLKKIKIIYLKFKKIILYVPLGSSECFGLAFVLTHMLQMYKENENLVKN